MVRLPRVAAVVAVALLCAASSHAFSLACCEDGNGAALSSCTCLLDDTPITATVSSGAYQNYHWILTNWSLISVPDEVRTSINFEVAPCGGNAHLYVRPVELPFPTAADTTWNASADHAINSIASRLSYAQFFVSVEGVAASTKYTIAAQLYEENFPRTSGGGGIVVQAKNSNDELLLPDDTMSMLVSFNASTDVRASEYTYRVYVHALTGSSPCRDGASATEKEQCILTTPCGVNSTMVPKTGWFAATPGANTTVEVPGLEQNQEYTFVVLGQHPNGRQVAYTGTTGTPKYERVTAAASSQTIIIVACVAGAVIILLIIGIIVAKVYLNRAFRSNQKRLKSKAASSEKRVTSGDSKPAAGGDAAEVKSGDTGARKRVA